MHHGVIIKTKKNGCIISCASSLEMPELQLSLINYGGGGPVEVQR